MTPAPLRLYVAEFLCALAVIVIPLLYLIAFGS